MSSINGGGKIEFASKDLAVEFACGKVKEGWITHIYPTPGKVTSTWTVSWWCQ